MNSTLAAATARAPVSLDALARRGSEPAAPPDDPHQSTRMADVVRAVRDALVMVEWPADEAERIGACLWQWNGRAPPAVQRTNGSARWSPQCLHDGAQPLPRHLPLSARSVSEGTVRLLNMLSQARSIAGSPILERRNRGWSP